MPMVTVTVGKKLTPEQVLQLKKGLGEKISLIPGKAESNLMVDIVDGHQMFFRGERVDCAFVDVRLYTKAPYEDKSNFVQAVCQLLEEVGVERKNIYLNFSEFENWGSGAGLR